MGFFKKNWDKIGIAIIVTIVSLHLVAIEAILILISTPLYQVSPFAIFLESLPWGKTLFGMFYIFFFNFVPLYLFLWFMYTKTLKKQKK